MSRDFTASPSRDFLKSPNRDRGNRPGTRYQFPAIRLRYQKAGHTDWPIVSTIHRLPAGEPFAGNRYRKAKFRFVQNGGPGLVVVEVGFGDGLGPPTVNKLTDTRSGAGSGMINSGLGGTPPSQTSTTYYLPCFNGAPFGDPTRGGYMCEVTISDPEPFDDFRSEALARFDLLTDFHPDLPAFESDFFGTVFINRYLSPRKRYALDELGEVRLESEDLSSLRAHRIGTVYTMLINQAVSSFGYVDRYHFGTAAPLPNLTILDSVSIKIPAVEMVLQKILVKTDIADVKTGFTGITDSLSGYNVENQTDLEIGVELPSQVLQPVRVWNGIVGEGQVGGFLNGSPSEPFAKVCAPPYDLTVTEPGLP
jgi:hypothetical protein